MADEEQVAAEAVETAVEQPVEQVEAAQAPEVEARARRMGWHPKDEYDGSGRPPDKWVSAEEFVRRGEESLPVLKDRNRKLDGKVNKLEKTVEEGNKLLRDLVEHQSERERKAVEKALAAAKIELREAVSVGDVERAERATDEIAEHKETLKAPVKVAAPVKDDAPEAPPEITAWVEANKWFDTNPKMRALAVSEYGELLADKSLSETQRLARTRAEVVKRFPEQFTNPRRSEASAVEGGAGPARNRNGAKSWNDLPSDVRAIADRLVAQKVVTKEGYLKSYQW